MIYLDYQATTPLAPQAREAMMPWLAGPEAMRFANPHSPHRAGRAAAAAVEVAREQVAALLPPGGRVVFTSGATEAINLVAHTWGRAELRPGDAVVLLGRDPIGMAALWFAATVPSRTSSSTTGNNPMWLILAATNITISRSTWPGTPVKLIPTGL